MSNSNCIFCGICAKKEPAELVYEDDEIVVFKDIKPSAKHHYLAVPIKHIQNISKLNREHKPLVEKLVAVGKKVLEEKGCDLNDIRLGFHCPPFNSVGHLHLHVLAPVSQMSFYSSSIFMPNTWWFTTAEDVLKKLEN